MLPSDSIEENFRLMTTQKSALKRLGLVTLEDLLFHIPSRYERMGDANTISSAKPGDSVVLYGTLSKLATKKSWKTKKPMSEGYLEDGTGRIKLMWFFQPYMAKMLTEGIVVKVSGKVAGEGAKRYVANPEVERSVLPPKYTLLEESKTDEAIYPMYPESRGITSKWFYHANKKLLEEGLHKELIDPVPEELLSRYHLPTIQTALVWAHTPKDLKNAESARKRFAFNEVFYIQVQKQKERATLKEEPALSVAVELEKTKKFIDSFPFSPTKAQQKAINEVFSDFIKGHPMSRLLEGDVGSGKTAVAAATAYAVVTSRPKGQDFGRLQVAYMAPTEILAKQQFESFISFFKELPVNIGLITGSGYKKFPSKINREVATDISRAQLLKWVKSGEIPILVGTHSLIQKSVEFENLAYVIIDEQHRFGTAQRKKLAKKEGDTPHLLSMTATPIPRTLALTIYGDLDLSILDEMPKGRKEIKTELVPPQKREEVYAFMKKELKEGRQAYVICPRIDEPDPAKAMAVLAKSAKKECERLRSDIFPEYSVGLLHSKLKPKEKDETMQKFLDGEIDILVATSVVEVGVNVPNATMIVIEGAERFGLSQLHQLRGRVLRSTHQAYCFLFSDSKAKPTMDRLKALTTAKNGFELAERDLELRGSGELYGTRQWGLSDIGMEAIKNIKMVEAARKEAEELVKSDPSLKKHPELANQSEDLIAELHFE